MTDLQVISEPAAAVAALDPMRRDILAALAEPGSATSVAAALRLPRQKVNYHLRTLEAHGLVHEVGTRQRRGLRERLVQASATAYLVGPDALGDLAADPARTDRLSSRYLIALAARLVREVGQLASLADAAGKPLASLAIDTEIRFASASDRAAFTADLRDAVLALSARYHDERAPDGRTHRLVIAAHPTLPPQTTTKEPT
ncbi:ArsR/SmtB family transcription factor [Nostocoides sp.]|mgnify:CR=1 FL=1|jgi:DNA-binding transcriptional ArsR family regulator|uniref:ArsR/SmtB family transcription factor n=1 Tax=Nostocoides sp. TaxID=1917966 RepID=UPI002C760F61|nr:helix-turn-helix domain-containing protein [Tetrasphaera sp.]